MDSDPSSMGQRATRPLSRRSLLSAGVAIAYALIGLLLAVPGTAYVLDPLLRNAGKKRRWLRVARLETLSADAPTQAVVMGARVDAWTREPRVQLGTVWLRKVGQHVLALSAECPHLGCKVAYDKQHNQFACPCHHSTFALDGSLKGGPAPRSMDPLPARVVDGSIEVRFARFRAQIKQRVELG